MATVYEASILRKESLRSKESDPLALERRTGTLHVSKARMGDRSAEPVSSIQADGGLWKVILAIIYLSEAKIFLCPVPKAFSLT